jgi:hypothetical protein
MMSWFGIFGKLDGKLGLFGYGFFFSEDTRDEVFHA